MTAEQTPGGSAFDGKGLYNPGSPVSKEQADKIWGRLSERYAQNAAGDVTAYTHDPWEGSVWLTKELPALKKNGSVTSINVIDP